MLNTRSLLMLSALACFAMPAYAVDATGDSKSESVHEDWSKMPADMKEGERAAFLEKWKSMSPEEKKAFHEKHRAERLAKRKEWEERWEKATPEERAKMTKMREERKEDLREAREERRKKMKEQWEKATPEEREAMKKKREERREVRKELHDMHEDKHGGSKGHGPAR